MPEPNRAETLPRSPILVFRAEKHRGGLSTRHCDHSQQHHDLVAVRVDLEDRLRVQQMLARRRRKT